MSRTGNKPKDESRTARPDIFDFSTPDARPAHQLAARVVTVAQLESLFECLDRADEQFTVDARASALAALQAIAEFLVSTPQGKGGRFSRPLELLLAELRLRAPGNKSDVLPAAGRGAGGVLTRPNNQYVKAAAAYAVEFLYMRTGMALGPAAGEVAGALTSRGFRFAVRRSGKAGGVLAWRRDYRRKSVSRAAAYFRGLVASPPIQATGDGGFDRIAIKNWLAQEIARAGYGAVT